MYYLISDNLEKVTLAECMKGIKPYVVIMDSSEWQREKDIFHMGIDLDIEYDRIHTTKAEVNYDSLTGGFTIPDKRNIAEMNHEFTFALDEKGIVFIDDDGLAGQIVEELQMTRKWKIPSLERFLYDFLNKIVFGDLAYLSEVEDRLAAIEDDILEGKATNMSLTYIVEIRRELLRLRTHYEQLIDLGQELSENENNFFAEHNLRYFDMFSARVMRLQDIVTYLRDYCVQIRDLYANQLAVRQNNTMTVLTVVTTIFMPLTLIVGWYGMNFRYMPELDSPLAYPIVIIVCIAIVILSFVYFRKKNWL
ncbi:MAG TPA: magnesium transporter CorA [Lachnospiraceae bacterium]|nr:magnesium transporter CorA [Lachnospiraceae bacterium]